MSAQTYIAPIVVTLVYLAIYYAGMINLLIVKTRLVKTYRARGEKYDRYFSTDREQLAADRKVGNMLEHMPPFLALMWLAAVFVGPNEAAVAGAVYTLARLLYPFLLGRKLGRGIGNRVLYATFTGYAVLLYFFVRVAMALVGGDAPTG